MPGPPPSYTCSVSPVSTPVNTPTVITLTNPEYGGNPSSFPSGYAISSVTLNTNVLTISNYVYVSSTEVQITIEYGTVASGNLYFQFANGQPFNYYGGFAFTAGPSQVQCKVTQVLIDARSGQPMIIL
jgi:hypothetical protein